MGDVFNSIIHRSGYNVDISSEREHFHLHPRAGGETIPVVSLGVHGAGEVKAAKLVIAGDWKMLAPM